MQAQFRTREGWGFFKERVEMANEYMVKEFYSNVHHIVLDSKVTKVRDKIVVFDGKSLNEFLGFGEEDESQYLEKLAMKEEVRPWLAEHLAAPGTVPVWLKAQEKIFRNTLNFEAKGWLTFVCSRLDPSTHDHSAPFLGLSWWQLSWWASL